MDNEWFFEVMKTIFPFVFIIMFVGTIVYFFLVAFSPKFRGKMMSRQVKAQKYMMEESKDDLKKIEEHKGEVEVDSKKEILDKHEGKMKDISKKEADINKEKVKTYAKAIKEGLEEETIYCKHCGTLIASDSKFCKKCGKEQ